MRSQRCGEMFRFLRGGKSKCRRRRQCWGGKWVCCSENGVWSEGNRQGTSLKFHSVHRHKVHHLVSVSQSSVVDHLLSLSRGLDDCQNFLCSFLLTLSIFVALNRSGARGHVRLSDAESHAQSMALMMTTPHVVALIPPHLIKHLLALSLLLLLVMEMVVMVMGLGLRVGLIRKRTMTNGRQMTCLQEDRGEGGVGVWMMWWWSRR